MQTHKTIGLLHYTAPPVVGGVESVMAQHARLLDEAGYTVRVIAGRESEHFTRIQFSHIPLVDSRHPEVMAAKEALDIGQIPSHFEQLVQQIQTQLITAVSGLNYLIAHNVCSLHKNLALTAALRHVCAQPGAPHLIIWHHDLAWTTPRYATELTDGWPWELIRQDWPEVASTHVVVSQLRQHELANLLNIAADTIHVIPSGLEVDNFLKLEPQTVELLKK
jgi:glycosyltransferase involved in cell wall biosynthesis